MENSKNNGSKIFFLQFCNLRLIASYLFLIILLSACDKKTKTPSTHLTPSSATARIVEVDKKNGKLVVKDLSTQTTTSCTCPCSVEIEEVTYSCK